MPNAVTTSSVNSTLVLGESQTTQIQEVSPKGSKTIDLGKGKVTTDTAPGDFVIKGNTLSSSQILEVASERVPNLLAQEILSGFSPESQAVLEISGARTVGQFVVTPIKAPAGAISAALKESVARTSTDFVRIKTVESIAVPGQIQIQAVNKNVSNNDEMASIFLDSGLAVPSRLSDLPTPINGSWIQVAGSATGYVPNSIVYLALTSDPIVVSEAVVDKFGNAQFSGVFPIEVVGTGAHSIRIIGKRLIKGVTVNSQGEIKVSDNAFNEIYRFDMNTNSTLRYLGFNAEGGTRATIRVVPIRSTQPWWTIWFIAWTIFIGLIIKLGRYVKKKRDIWIGVVLIVLSVAPSQFYGWTEIAYPVMYWGEGLGLLGLGLWLFVPPIKKKIKGLDSAN